jgi:hypothetical protein
MCETVPSLMCLSLTFLELFFMNDLLKLLEGDRSYILDPKKHMDQRWPHMVQFNGCALQQWHQKSVLSLNLQLEEYMEMQNKESLLVKLHHYYEELYEAALVIKHKIVHANVLVRIKWMHFFNVQEPSLKSMVLVPYVEHFPRHVPKIWVSCKKSSNLSFFSF